MFPIKIWRLFFKDKDEYIKSLRHDYISYNCMSLNPFFINHPLNNIYLNSTPYNSAIYYPNGAAIYTETSGDGPGDIVIRTYNGGFHYSVFYNNGDFGVPGNVTAFSDRRVKDNLIKIPDAPKKLFIIAVPAAPPVPPELSVTPAAPAAPAPRSRRKSRCPCRRAPRTAVAAHRRSS